MAFTNLLTDILSCDAKDKEKLQKFTAYYGIMMQVVNDNWDFVPGYMQQDTKAKCQQDMQSDIRNKNMTLPLVLYLHFNPSEQTLIKKYLNSFKTKKYSERREKLVFEAIRPILLGYCLPVGEALAACADGIVPENGDITGIARHNRFYRIIVDYLTYEI